MPRKLKVGFLVDDLIVRSQAVEVIDFLHYHNHLFDTPHILYGYHKKISKKSKLRKIIFEFRLFFLIRLVLFNTLLRFIKAVEEKKIAESNPRVQDFSSFYSAKPLNFIKLDLNISNLKNFLEFSVDDINRIKSLRFDVIVRLGTGILKGDILNSAKFGIVSLHLGDNRVNRGGPAGFWEVLKGEPSSGFIVQKLNSELDGGEVLFRGNIMTASTWTRNYINLKAKAPYFLCRVLKDIAMNQRLPDTEEISLHYEPLLKFDTRLEILLKYMYKIWGGILRYQVKTKVFKQHSDWRIAFSTYSGLKKSLWRYSEIPNNKNSFFADPFVISHDGISTIFVEEFDKVDKKGSISAINITDSKPLFLGRVLEENFHLSFPFVFKHRNNLYMIPETSRANQIRLYVCTTFPNKWKLLKILVDNINAADTMIIKKHSKWFLLTNICSAGTGDLNSELHIFYADSLFSKKWFPIKSGNPVVVDSLRARNAGLITNNGNIYRINQIHGMNHYGKSIGINRIDILNTQKFQETRIQNVKPNFRTGLKSIHHLNSDEYFSVIDYY